jgi:dihydrofolate reductase
MIALTVAYSKNRVIGNKGMIPWKIKGEQKRFRELTTGNIVVMGRHSFEEIGKPLPNRMTFLVSNTIKIEEENCKTVTSLQEAIKLAENKDIYISGGAMLYREALPLVDKMYITIIEKEFEGDTYFPVFNENEFIKTYEEEFAGEVPYRYITYERNDGRNEVT